MKSKLLRISILILTIILLLQVVAFAAISKLTLKVATDKNTYNVGDKVTVTVDWTEGMQAAVYKVKYDSEKLDFNSANITASYYNAGTEGVISVNWASLEEVDYTKMTFEFTAKAAGTADIKVEDPKFATGTLEEPSSYDITTAGSKTITISKIETQEPETQEPSTQEPSTQQPSTQEPSTQEPSTQQPSTQEPSTQEPSTQQPSKQEPSKQEPSKQEQTTNKDDTMAAGKMPQTGAEFVGILFVAVIIFIGTIGFVKYKKLSDI